jgi:hypothetical protein
VSLAGHPYFGARLAPGGIADRRGGIKSRSAKSHLRVALGALGFVELFECRDIGGFDFRGSGSEHR